MAKTSAELEKEFIETAAEKTGKSIPQWLSTAKASGIEKQGALLEWLKKGHGLNHMQAQFIAGMYFNEGAPVYGNADDLLEKHFLKCPEMRPLFDALAGRIVAAFPGTQLIPKKSYLSFTAVREFAAVNARPGEIRLGIDLRDEPFTPLLQKSKLTGPMPRISHMLVFTTIEQWNGPVIAYVQRSFRQTHPEK